jgi:outer membrane protein assembly factor BamB
MRKASRTLGVLITFLILSRASAQEWTRFRGPNGTGIGHGLNLPEELTQKNVNWINDLPGIGHSSPVLWGEKIFLTCTGDKAGGISVLCIALRDGKTEWRKDFPLTPFPRHRFNSYASATPAVDSEHVYVIWNEPDHYFLAALDHSGKTIWQRDFGAFVSQHGCGASPIVCDDKVILTDFQDDQKFVEGPTPDTRNGSSSIIALDARTGKTVWQLPRKSTVVSYSTPCLYETKGRERALIFNSQSHGISAVDPATGKILWEYETVFNRRTVSSPLIADDLILGSCGSGGGGSVLSAIKAADAKSNHQPTLAYQIKKSAPYVPTGIVIGDLLWLWSDGGIISCLRAPAGQVLYQERVGGDFFGSPVSADGRLYSISTSGELVTIEASDHFKVLGRFPLNELCRSTPAIANGRLLVRTEKHLWCFGALRAPVTP